ncbi:hypothetical protein [Paraliomyxa miuraensis]|uniref:hypothetical protein n=1 Tax=Paraliomyxa miuraensis TaxID=376150 RepID=UPI002259D968|nr:hypothetical protein [Paraliomyxa miuraensis]MCX4242637.1 hypothetical protein [Paraliomyxa miuraensis]
MSDSNGIKKRIKLDKQSVRVDEDALQSVKEGSSQPSIFFGRVGRCTATGFCYNTGVSHTVP